MARPAASRLRYLWRLLAHARSMTKPTTATPIAAAPALTSGLEASWRSLSRKRRRLFAGLTRSARLSIVRARLAERFTLEDIDYRTGGPARYVRVKETGGRLGFITPLTHNFCESCNRVRVTCTGTLYMCLGQSDAADLRKPLRASESNELLYSAIDEAISRKPKGHDFVIDRRHAKSALPRHMSMTGG